MDFNRICYNCMRPKVTANGPCPHCGFDNSQYFCAPHHLRPLTPLNGRYIIGKVIGSGGFGITYKAYDTQLRVVVAIKELFLKDFCSRGMGQSVIIPSKERDYFEESKKKFLQEARVLAKYNALNDAIVAVKEHFEENNTAYIVMEFLDGITLKALVQRKGKLTFEETRKLMEPVCAALSRIHKDGVIHKDVSPDNIIILNNGGIKLLDFGGAVSVYMRNKGYVISFKRGYAPPEQYSERGIIGAWTDVYAAAATFYYCITGTRPTDAMERRAGKDLVPPSRLGASVSPKMEKRILKAMDMDLKARYQSMEEFWVDMNEPKKSRVPAVILSVFITAAVITGIVFLVMQHKNIGPFSSSSDSGEPPVGASINDISGTKAVCCVYQKYGKYYLTAVMESGGSGSLQMWRETIPSSSQKFEFVPDNEGNYRIYYNNGSQKYAWQWDKDASTIILAAPSDNEYQVFHITYDDTDDIGGARYKIATSDNSNIVNLDDAAKKDIDIQPVKTMPRDDARRSHEDMYLEG